MEASRCMISSLNEDETLPTLGSAKVHIYGRTEIVSCFWRADCHPDFSVNAQTSGDLVNLTFFLCRLDFAREYLVNTFHSITKCLSLTVGKKPSVFRLAKRTTRPKVSNHMTCAKLRAWFTWHNGAGLTWPYQSERIPHTFQIFSVLSPSNSVWVTKISDLVRWHGRHITTIISHTSVTFVAIKSRTDKKKHPGRQVFSVWWIDSSLVWSLNFDF